MATGINCTGGKDGCTCLATPAQPICRCCRGERGRDLDRRDLDLEAGG